MPTRNRLLGSSIPYTGRRAVYLHRETTGYYVFTIVTFRRVNHDNTDLRSSLLVRCKTQLSWLHSSEKFYSRLRSVSRTTSRKSSTFSPSIPFPTMRVEVV